MASRRKIRSKVLYRAGEKGRNRVALYARRSGVLYLAWYEPGGARRVESLGHRELNLGKAAVDQRALDLSTRRPASGVALTLAALFERYERRVTPDKSWRKQCHDRSAMALLVECLGDRTMVEGLDEGDVRRFIALRQARGDQRQGRNRGKPVSPRAVAYDLHLLKAACRWAVEQGWLRENPIKTKWLPVEQAPRRPMTTRTELDALLTVAPAVHPTARTLLLAVAETGHRISSVLGLRWPDVDLEAQQVRWRADLDKLGFEHQTAISDVLTAALRDWRRFTLAVGDTPVFPSDKNPAQPMSRHFARDLWERLEVAAGMRREAYRGWHSQRRLFANELRAAPLKDLKELGGGKDAQTVVRIYQQATMETMRQALQQRQRFG